MKAATWRRKWNRLSAWRKEWCRAKAMCEGVTLLGVLENWTPPSDDACRRMLAMPPRGKP